MVWRLLHLPSGLVCICHGNRDKCIGRPVTTTAAGELIYGYTFLMNTAAAGAGFAGLTLVNGDLDEYEIQSAAGSAAATYTQTSGTWFARVATCLFRPTTATQGVISGTISPAAGGSGATVSLSGAESATAVADANGRRMSLDCRTARIRLRQSLGGYTFSPVSQAVTMNGDEPDRSEFYGPDDRIHLERLGNIGPAGSGDGATVTLSGSASGSTVADVNGNYTFAGVVNGSYTVTPSKSGYTFSPVNQAVNIKNERIRPELISRHRGQVQRGTYRVASAPRQAGTARQLR